MNAPSHVHAYGLSRLGFDLLQKVDRVGLKERHIGIGVDGVKSAGRVPGRASGQDGALDQRHVGPTKFCQVVNDRSPDDPSTDNNDAVVCFHPRSLDRNGSTHATQLFGWLHAIVHIAGVRLILSASVAFVALSEEAEYAYARLVCVGRNPW